MKKVIELNFVDVKDFKGDHNEAVIVKGDKGSFCYGVFKPEEGHEEYYLLNDNSPWPQSEIAQVASIPDALLTLRDAVEVKPKKKEKEGSILETIAILDQQLQKSNWNGCSVALLVARVENRLAQLTTKKKKTGKWSMWKHIRRIWRAIGDMEAKIVELEKDRVVVIQGTVSEDTLVKEVGITLAEQEALDVLSEFNVTSPEHLREQLNSLAFYNSIKIQTYI